MRQIGTINNESQARIFASCLYTQGITNDVEAEGPAVWVVWVHDEDRINEARELMARYLANPTAAEWKEAAKKASALRQQEEKSQQDYQRRLRERDELFPPAASYRVGLLTLFLIGLCGYLAVQSNLARNLATAELLQITKSHFTGFLPEVLRGEVWRLLTPAFLHMTPLHLICNMLWLFQFGSLIEDRKGGAYFLVMVVGIGVLSNIAQYAMLLHLDLPAGRFGGMSGVVYGLFGYVWMHGKHKPASGMRLDESTVLLMILWFGVCFTGLAGPIANTAHATGLLLGMAWGYLAAKRG